MPEESVDSDRVAVFQERSFRNARVRRRRPEAGFSREVGK